MCLLHEIFYVVRGLRFCGDVCVPVCVVRRCDLHLIYNVVVVLDIRVRNPPGRFYVDSLGMDIFAPTDTNSLKSTQNPPTA